MLKDHPPEELPREKLKLKGPHALTDSDLIALILKTGNREKNVLALSRQLLIDNPLEELAHQTFEELSKTLGPVKTCQVIAAFELGKRALSQHHKKNTITSSKDAAHLLLAELSGKKQEHFILLLLDTRLQLIKIETLFIGTINSSIVHPREIFRSAIKTAASALILVHNHPSGQCDPSEEDLRITKTIQKAGKLLDIRLLDHIIIGKGTYLSMKETGFI